MTGLSSWIQTHVRDNYREIKKKWKGREKSERRGKTEKRSEGEGTITYCALEKMRSFPPFMKWTASASLCSMAALNV